MDVLLLNPEWIRKRGSIWKGVAGAMPPLGVAYIAGYLESKGVSVGIIDMQVEFDPPEDILKKLDTAPKHIGITATTTTVTEALRLGKICREIFPDSKITFGGVHPTILSEEILENDFVDYVIRGEGEESYYKLVSGEDAHTIKGLTFREKGNIIRNEEAELIANLDLLPFPAYHMLKMKRYIPSLGSYKRLPSISMITTRGCPGKCTYCFGSYLGHRIRMHSAEYMIEQIKLLQKNYGIKEIAFYDDTFTASKRRVKEFCESLDREKIDLTWVCFARVDFINEEMIKMMKKAGCHQLLYGIESGNEKILQSMGKHAAPKKVREVVRWTKKAGVECRTSFMLGNPGETENDLKDTIDFSIKLNADLAMYNVTTPFPGTDMYRWADEKGYITTKDWSQYDFSTSVMTLPDLPPETIHKYYQMAHKKFYGRPSYFLKRISRIRSINDIIVAVKAVVAIWFK